VEALKTAIYAGENDKKRKGGKIMQVKVRTTPMAEEIRYIWQRPVLLLREDCTVTEAITALEDFIERVVRSGRLC